MSTHDTQSTPRPAERMAAAYWAPMSELSKWIKNPRKNARAAPMVARSIRKYGFVAPVVVWESRKRLVAGHTRLAALQSILASDPTFVPRDAPGVGLVPVRFHEFTDEAEANAYSIADNKLNEAAEWDDALLAEVLLEMHDADESLLAETGLSDDEIKKLLDGPEDGGTGGDPGPDRYQSKYGVICMCRDEAHQQEVYQQLKADGYECKVVVV